MVQRCRRGGAAARAPLASRQSRACAPRGGSRNAPARSPVPPPRRRDPCRNRASGTRLARARRSPRRSSRAGMPARHSGCLRSDISATGANSFSTAVAVRSSSVPASVAANGWPAVSSATRSHVASRAATRRARLRSGVIRLAVRPGVSAASRSISAMVSASSSAVAASMRGMPVRAAAISVLSAAAAKRCHSSVVAAGRMASQASDQRARWAALLSARASCLTSPRARPRASSSLLTPNCGCSGCWPIEAQLSSSSVRSSGGSTRAPLGRAVTARMRSSAAGSAPVMPATITGAAGGAARSCSAATCMRRLRRATADMSPCPAKCAGQNCVTIRRNSSVADQCSENSSGTSSVSRAASIPSISNSSMSRASSWASLAACAGVRARRGGKGHDVGAVAARLRLRLRPPQHHQGEGELALQLADHARRLTGAFREVRHAGDQIEIVAALGDRLDPGQKQRAAPETLRNASCSARVARRVGRYSVMPASCNGPGRGPPGTGRLPLTRASARVSRNGRPPHDGIHARTAVQCRRGGLGLSSSEESHGLAAARLAPARRCCRRASRCPPCACPMPVPPPWPCPTRH